MSSEGIFVLVSEGKNISIVFTDIKYLFNLLVGVVRRKDFVCHNYIKTDICICFVAINRSIYLDIFDIQISVVIVYKVFAVLKAVKVFFKKFFVQIQFGRKPCYKC